MSNFTGFKGFTKPAKIDPKVVEERKARGSYTGLYLYYTGGPYRLRKGSGRSGALRTVTEVKTPIPLSTVAERAATAINGLGYAPDFVRAGAFLHLGSKPAVYFVLEKKEDGSFVAAADVPFPEGRAAPIKAGETIIPAGGAGAKLALPKPAKAAPKAVAKTK